MAFFFPTGRDGAVFFFFFRGPGRDGYFWRWQFFWRDGAKSLHRPAKGGLNRPASRPCKALVLFSKYGEEHVCNLRRFLERLTKSNLSRIYVYAKAQTEESQRQRRHPVAPSSSSYRRNSSGQVLSNRPLGPECLCHRNTPLKTSNIVGLKLGGLDNALGGLPNALGGLATTPRRCFVRGGGGGSAQKDAQQVWRAVLTEDKVQHERWQAVQAVHPRFDMFVPRQGRIYSRFTRRRFASRTVDDTRCRRKTVGT